MRRAFTFITTSIRTHWRMKAALGLALSTFFCLPYFALQRILVFPVHSFPLSAIDRAIDFDPAWVSVYQSVYLLLIAVPWMATRREDLRKYATGFVAVSIAGFLCFFFVPVRGPRPDGETTDLMFRILQSYDRPLNCFPSLHVGLAVYTMLVAARLVDRAASFTRWSILSIGWLWTMLIAYAALATKQHYAVDLPAGALLAYACHWSTWHTTQRSTAHVESPLGLSHFSGFGLVRKRDRRLSSNTYLAGRRGS